MSLSRLNQQHKLKREDVRKGNKAGVTCGFEGQLYGRGTADRNMAKIVVASACLRCTDKEEIETWR